MKYFCKKFGLFQEFHINSSSITDVVNRGRFFTFTISNRTFTFGTIASDETIIMQVSNRQAETVSNRHDKKLYTPVDRKEFISNMLINKVFVYKQQASYSTIGFSQIYGNIINFIPYGKIEHIIVTRVESIFHFKFRCLKHCFPEGKYMWLNVKGMFTKSGIFNHMIELKVIDPNSTLPIRAKQVYKNGKLHHLIAYSIYGNYKREIISYSTKYTIKDQLTDKQPSERFYSKYFGHLIIDRYVDNLGIYDVTYSSTEKYDIITHEWHGTFSDVWDTFKLSEIHTRIIKTNKKNSSKHTEILLYNPDHKHKEVKVKRVDDHVISTKITIKMDFGFETITTTSGHTVVKRFNHLKVLNAFADLPSHIIYVNDKIIYMAFHLDNQLHRMKGPAQWDIKHGIFKYYQFGKRTTSM